MSPHFRQGWNMTAQNKSKTASAIILTLFLSLAVHANDGHEFHRVRPANPAGGKLLTPKELAFKCSLDPQRETGYFDSDATPIYPCLCSCNGSLYSFCSPTDSILVEKGGNGIVYGESVSRHEFNTDKGIFPSPDGRKSAFYRKDESKVGTFPLVDIAPRCGALNAVRYPMAGCASEHLKVGVYDFAGGNVVYLDTEGEFDKEQYLTNVCWSPDGQNIYLQVLDRAQQNLRLNCYNATDGHKTATILSEHSDTWVEPRRPLQWIKGCNDKCIYTTDNRDGYWNLYLVNLRTNDVRRLTKVDKDVEYVANDGKYIYFTAPDYHPVNNYLWKVNLRGEKLEQLTKEEGWHTIIPDKDLKQYVDIYECLDKAPVSLLKDVRTGRTVKKISGGDDPTEGWAFSEIDMGTVTSANGCDLNYYRLVKPLGFDPSKKYPLIVYVYGGPHSQMVTNRFLGGLRRWEMYAAQKGFVVFTMDGRGTSRHGAAYEHAIYRRCGQCEMADQMQAVSMLKDIAWIDEDRIGVYGWSYGGFMSLTLSTNHPEIFKVCVAGGPVIDWKWYEVMYGERYMSTPQNNPEGFAATSLLPMAAKVQARTLVVQGAVDDTVVPLHALSFLQECIDNGKQIDYFTYPKAKHNMKGSDRAHLADKITDYFIRNL